MSLNVYLYKKRYLSYDKGETYIEDEETIYSANITHNLGEMAKKAGIYKALWRPEELGAVTAKDIIPILRIGYKKLKKKPEYFKRYNSLNGWGLYDNFLPFVEYYLQVCEENPDAIIRVSR